MKEWGKKKRDDKEILEGKKKEREEIFGGEDRSEAEMKDYAEERR